MNEGIVLSVSGGFHGPAERRADETLDSETGQPREFSRCKADRGCPQDLGTRAPGGHTLSGRRHGCAHGGGAIPEEAQSRHRPASYHSSPYLTWHNAERKNLMIQRNEFGARKLANDAVAIGKKFAGTAYPNPSRTGCPDAATLKA